MTFEQDPKLQQVFDAAKTDLPTEAFADGVMSGIDRSRRRTIIGWSALGLLLVAVALLLTPPLVDAVSLLSRALPESLIEFEDPDALISHILAPLNSSATLVAVGFLGLRSLYKRLF